MNTIEASALPDRFSASIGGFMGESYSIELRDGTLIFTTTSPDHASPEHTPIRPTEAQWREFRRALDGLNVWQWAGDYPNPGVLDGSHWSFDIAYSDRALTTHGDNNYPDADGKPTNEPDPLRPSTVSFAPSENSPGGALNDSQRSASARSTRF